MTYLVMSLPFIGVGIAAFLAGGVRARARGTAGGYLRTWAITTAALVLLTAVFDNVMMAAGLFDYGDRHTSGIRFGLMPVEDFLYPVVGAMLLGGAAELLRGTDRRSVS